MNTQDLSEIPPSPTNACIRAAKRVIAALNLPGSVIYWHPEHEHWCFSSAKPEAHEYGWVFCDGVPVLLFIIPTTAIPPWPGDWRESWITLDTKEI